MNAPLRIGLIVAAVVVAIVLLIALRPDAPEVADDTAATDVPTDEAETTEETATEGTATEGSATQATTTQEAPNIVRAQVAIGPDGPSGVERIRARQGQRVILLVRSEVADHVHVHGYDLFADVAPGKPARIQFRADIPGRFEIELEDRHELVAQLRVDP